MRHHRRTRRMPDTTQGCVEVVLQGSCASLDSADRLRADQRQTTDLQGTRILMLSHVCYPTGIERNDTALR